SFEKLAGWLADHESAVVLAPPAPSARLLAPPRAGIRWAGTWLLGVALALGAAGWWLSPARARPFELGASAALAGGLGAAALALRLALGTWGPLHINGQGP